jgi:hypothetical protein
MGATGKAGLSGAAAHPVRAAPASPRLVRDFRQILLWPLQLLPRDEGDGDPLRALAGSPWTESADALPEDPSRLTERGYREFVAFLPHVQRFLYGTRGPVPWRPAGASPIRTFTRSDIARVRITPSESMRPLLFGVARLELRFFCDVDVLMLALEIEARDLPLADAQEVMYRFGRAYPSGWTDTGEAWHCPRRVEWLDAEGRVLAASDYEQREGYLASVCRYQVPKIASHWKHLLSPAIMSHSEETGSLRYRLVEHNWIPVMACLAVDDPASLTDNDHARLGLVLPPGDPAAAPYAAPFLDDFTHRCCYDRFHDPARAGDWIDTRIMCCGHAFVVVGDARQPVFADAERGILAQFRNAFFLLGLIAHLHRAALLMLSDRLARIIGRLDTGHPQSVESFHADIRDTLETFLRFSHRYWFYEVSNQAVARDLFRLWSEHLATARLYGDVRESLRDMSEYLDSDLLRRSSATIVRLTVVAILSLIGTATTGFLGMNLLDAADASLTVKTLYFAVVAVLVTALTVYTVCKASRIAEFFDVLADESLHWRRKLWAFLAVWEKR